VSGKTLKSVLLILLLTGVDLLVNAQVIVTKTASGLLFTENGDSVLFYQVQPKSVDGKFARCNYIHPLWAPDGTVLTEDFPADHLHHRGIFWAWHQIYADGKNLGDGWELKNFSQKVDHYKIRKAKNGSLKLITTVEYKSPEYISGEKPFLLENTEITIHQAEKNYRRIDFEIKLRALANGLEIGGSDDEKGYSGFSVRMKLPDDVTFTGPEGVVKPENTAVQSPGFIDVSGSVLKNNEKGGIVILDHSENPGYPQPWILRSKNSMQNAAFPGRRRIALDMKNPLILKYSIIVYEGEFSDIAKNELVE
jgi:hypothetical protein